jgi:hypothetical protein
MVVVLTIPERSAEDCPAVILLGGGYIAELVVRSYR